MTLIAVHVGAAMKHVLDRDNVFWRMWPRALR
jgi:cytochrome b561